MTKHRDLATIIARHVDACVTELRAAVSEQFAAALAGGGSSHPYWSILVATHDGSLLSYDRERVKLVPSPAAVGGPYR